MNERKGIEFVVQRFPEAQTWQLQLHCFRSPCLGHSTAHRFINFPRSAKLENWTLLSLITKFWMHVSRLWVASQDSQTRTTIHVYGGLSWWSLQLDIRQSSWAAILDLHHLQRAVSQVLHGVRSLGFKVWVDISRGLFSLPGLSNQAFVCGLGGRICAATIRIYIRMK